MGREYRFLDRWVIPAPPDAAYDVVSEALLYPAWWRSFCLRATGDPGPAAPGKRADLLVKGFLPYRVRLTLECEVAEPPVRLVSRIEGDLVGRGVDLRAVSRGNARDPRLAALGRPPPVARADAGRPAAAARQPHLVHEPGRAGDRRVRRRPRPGRRRARARARLGLDQPR